MEISSQNARRRFILHLRIILIVWNQVTKRTLFITRGSIHTAKSRRLMFPVKISEPKSRSALFDELLNDEVEDLLTR